MKEFMKVVVPVMLSGRDDYYVKGGLAYDMYFLEKTNSIDWDVVGSTEFANYIKNYLTEYSKRLDLTLNSRECDFNGKMVQFSFEGYTVDGSDPYFMDVIINDEKLEYITVDNVNYMTLMNFVVDLLETQTDRGVKANKYMESIGSEGNVLKAVKEFNDEYKFDIDIEGKTVKEVLDETLPDIIKYVELRSDDKVFSILQRVIFIPLKSAQNMEEISHITSGADEDPQDTLDQSDRSSTEEDQMSEMVDFISERYQGDILTSTDALSKNIQEAVPTFGKYTKTRKRYNNVIDISWENLSDSFKKYLLTHCREKKTDLNLFNLSPGCIAVAKCEGGNVIISRNTKGCVKEETISKLEFFDKKLGKNIK